ncbi:diguanylate cyclase [Colwellia piezophila]|uniref:diguanylate cyclase n=1 Tax=Colwellia piezophila TaxID=211668 RepID=UPI0003792756|nr:diguanylate cyclase [Colwellia piezophila]
MKIINPRESFQLSSLIMSLRETQLSTLYYSLALAFSVLLFSANVHAVEKVVLQLKWKHQFQFAGFYAAVKQGYYEEEGLSVEIRSADMQRSTSEVVLSGDAQYGISDSSLVLSRLKGRPLVVLAAIFQHSPMVLLTLESSRIISPLELKNKRVMYQRNIDDAVLLAMFIEMGLRENDHIYVPHTFSDNALINANVDAMSAYITDQPYFFRERGIAINIISPANYGIDFYGDMIFVEEQYLLAHKDQVLAFRRASLRGWDYAIKHQEEVVDWILANMETDKSRDHLLFEAERTERLIQPDLVELGYFSHNRFLRIANIYRQLGFAPAHAEISGINYLDYYKEDGRNLRWLYITGLIFLSLSILALVLWILNLRLKAKVVSRTRELEETTRSLEQHLRVLDQYVITASFTQDCTLTEVSKALCNISRYERQELIGKPLSFLLHPDTPEDTYSSLLEAIKNGQNWSGELLYCDSQGDDCWIYTEIEPQQDRNGLTTGYTAISVDVSDKKKMEIMSTTDSLTGLANRRKLDDALAQSLAEAQRYNKPLSVVMLDIDKFKVVNDSYGHIVGDQVIKTIANLLKSNVRDSDISGRWGGEEFLLVCPETELMGAQRVSELLRQIINGHHFLDIPNQSCSFGVAQWDHTESLNTLLERADKALYSAKTKGRNRVELGRVSGSVE